MRHLLIRSMRGVMIIKLELSPFGKNIFIVIYVYDNYHKGRMTQVRSFLSLI